MADRSERGKKRDGGSGGKLFYLLLGVVALGGVAFLLLAGRGDGGEPARPLPAWADQVQADPAAGVPLGAEDAPATIMEFADYQCPHCAQFGTFTGKLIRQNYVESGGQARWVLYDFPVGFPNSIPSAIAARCAGEQGEEAFWAMHDLLLARQSEWGGSDAPRRIFARYGEEIGLDGDAFRACMEERRPLEEIVASRRYGEQLAVQGTPTLFLNGRKLDNRTETTYQALERLILAAADSARAASDASDGEAGGEADGAR